MRTPQLTEQYGQVDRVSVARAILSSLSCATAGVRSNPRREKPAPPTSAPLRKVLRESSIAHPPTTSIAYRRTAPQFAETIILTAAHSQRACRKRSPQRHRDKRHREKTQENKNNRRVSLCL